MLIDFKADVFYCFKTGTSRNTIKEATARLFLIAMAASRLLCYIVMCVDVHKTERERAIPRKPVCHVITPQTVIGWNCLNYCREYAQYYCAMLILMYILIYEIFCKKIE